MGCGDLPETFRDFPDDSFPITQASTRSIHP
jgi:hypothetical protein